MPAAGSCGIPAKRVARSQYVFFDVASLQQNPGSRELVMKGMDYLSCVCLRCLTDTLSSFLFEILAQDEMSISSQGEVESRDQGEEGRWWTSRSVVASSPAWVSCWPAPAAATKAGRQKHRPPGQTLSEEKLAGRFERALGVRVGCAGSPGR